jgi:hypothetical protein
VNPSTLYFSKGWSIVQFVMMALVTGLVLWVVADTMLPATPPPTPQLQPHDSPFLYPERAPREQGLREKIQVMIVIACLPIIFWEMGIKFWRLLTPEPSVVLKGKILVLHPSFVFAPNTIPLAQISRVAFDRSDRVRKDWAAEGLTAWSLSNRLAFKAGASFRHTLLIDYFSEQGDPTSFRINDADVDGGVEQLRRFAEYLKMMAMLTA